MAWHVLYDTNTGEAKVICETAEIPDAETLYAKGLSVFDAPEGVDARRRAWDATARDFAPETIRPVYVDPSDFIGAFTPTEWVALKGSAVPAVVWFYDRINSMTRPINVESVDVANGFALMVALNLLTAERVEEIKTSLGA
jgi:hypothetical protein